MNRILYLKCLHVTTMLRVRSDMVKFVMSFRYRGIFHIITLFLSGRSYCITSHRMLMQCIDSLVQKVQSGVVINFEKIGPDPPPVGSEGKTLKNQRHISEV